MKFVLIVGDGAVGKMTVGQELTKITDLRLFHNHMTIEPVLELFGEFNTNVILKTRDIYFEEFAKSDKYGMIFTFMWAFDMKEDWDFVNNIVDLFKKYNSEIYLVELYAPLEVRLERNKTENRLINKPSKRDIEASDERLVNHTKNHRFISYENEIPFKNYIKIDNSNILAKDVAKMIKEQFNL
jgi:sugar-specific transcriptional regulator TrmB